MALSTSPPPGICAGRSPVDSSSAQGHTASSKLLPNFDSDRVLEHGPVEFFRQPLSHLRDDLGGGGDELAGRFWRDLRLAYLRDPSGGRTCCEPSSDS